VTPTSGFSDSEEEEGDEASRGKEHGRAAGQVPVDVVVPEQDEHHDPARHEDGAKR
jgi:hypothetical protein